MSLCYGDALAEVRLAQQAAGSREEVRAALGSGAGCPLLAGSD